MIKKFDDFNKDNDDIIYLFHHIHHNTNDENEIIHVVHHCGINHPDSDLDYAIEHCACKKHKIDKEIAIGHTTNENLEKVPLEIKFLEKCPEGGWHIESGIKNEEEDNV